MKIAFGTVSVFVSALLLSPLASAALTVTEMGKRLSKATRGVGDIHELDASSPFGRVSTPEDVAAVVTFLVSDANPYANGQKVNINGGG